MRLKLNRRIRTDHSTIGKLFVLDDDDVETELCHTLELPWNNNKRRESCIPRGAYEIVKRNYGFYYNAYRKKDWQPKHEFSIEISDVEGRGDILIHSGNYPRHTKGCVLVGMESGADVVLRSYEAYRKLYEILEAAFADGEEVFIYIDDESVEAEIGRNDSNVEDL